MRRRSLGRGLSELIAGDTTVQGRAIVDIPVGDIYPNRYQPRRQMSDEGLQELVQSVKMRGVLQPICVRRVGDRYEIVTGERRWRACQEAALSAVPCIVQDVSDRDSLQIALIENLQREDLTGIEAAHAYRQLINDFDLTQEQVAEFIGKSRPTIANTLRLLELPQDIQDSIQGAIISEGHGRALLALLASPEALTEAWVEVERKGLTVRETEELVRRIAKKLAKPEAAPAQPSRPATIEPNLAAAEERLQMALATKVKIKTRARGGGTIAINYHDDEELDRLLDMLAPGDGLLKGTP